MNNVKLFCQNLQFILQNFIFLSKISKPTKYECSVNLPLWGFYLDTLNTPMEHKYESFIF